ncbi:hypothetical protein ACIO14_15215 [Nocardia fluminea]|uniref:hypothetical protein n=1 Tax=Nocardia fluminea TaxID=134984 RepID=UPI00382400BE
MSDAQQDCERLDVVRGVLFDMHEAAWESMERDDFAATATEHAKLAYLKQVRPAVESEHEAASQRWHDAASTVALPIEPPVRVEPRLAPQRRAVVGRRRRSRGIERSR